MFQEVYASKSGLIKGRVETPGSVFRKIQPKISGCRYPPLNRLYVSESLPFNQKIKRRQKSGSSGESKSKTQKL